MLEEAADEFLGLQSHGARLVGAAVAIAHRNAVRVVLQDIVASDNYTSLVTTIRFPH